MKFCYVDESGTGDEPYAVMVGIVVDALRMRPTKTDWDRLLEELSKLARKEIRELHTRDFYAGNGPWRGIDGSKRAEVIGAILDWLHGRKHDLIYSAIDKRKWGSDFKYDPRYSGLNTIWRFLGLHLVLTIQKHHQKKFRNKGNTVLIFDNEEHERARFTDLVLNPPEWTDTYYQRSKRQDRLDQIIDAPYFADSRDVPLLQVADVVAFLLRRHLELEYGDTERYEDERSKIRTWVEKALESSIPRSTLYLKKGRCECAELFFTYAPPTLRD